MRFTIPVAPAANRYWRTRVATTRMGKRYVQTYVSPEARRYKILVWNQLKAAKIPVLEGPVAVSIWWIRTARRGDLDGRLKVALDALNGVAWQDDRQVVELHAHVLDGSQNEMTVMVAPPASSGSVGRRGRELL